MIRRLQFIIIAVILGTLLFVFAAVLLVLNLSVYQTSVERTDDFMATVVENDGFLFPPKDERILMPGGRGPRPNLRPEIMRSGRFFYAKVSPNGDILELNVDMMFDFSKEDALRYITSALHATREKGNIENFTFIAAGKPYGQMLVFAERSIEILLLERLNQTSLFAAGTVCLILSCLSVFLAKWMVAPVKNSFDKQRRFTSDASHELKTPLTIIGANVDVLQNEIGENQRLECIRAQSERMNGLVHDLLTLAKTDEGQTDIIWSNFNMSGTVLNTALEFESRAFEEGKRYSFDIKENITYVGDEKQIKQLVSVLIDNAIQYSDENGQIKVSLHRDGNRIRLSVFNSGVGVSDEERDKIFDRFYRIDESRSRETGGYGVGLSIAKAIIEAHKGKIVVLGEYGEWVRFEIVF